MRTKYLIAEIPTGFNAFEVAICFPDFVVHSDMARSMKLDPDKVLSAGFFSTSVGPEGEIRVDAYGESVSLNTKARMQDSKIIARSIGAVAM